MKRKCSAVFGGLSTLLILSGLLSGCTAREEKQTQVSVALRAVQSIDRRVVAATNDFGFDLMRRLDAKSKAQSNIVMSPLSICSALAMVYNGAAGSTRKAMANTLHLGALSPGEINRAHSALRANLQNADPSLETAIANSIWARQGTNFGANFLKRNRKYFGAKISSRDLSAPATLTEINRWVKTNTRGKIETIADRPYDAATMMVLINAVYFKGQWKDKFEKSATKSGDFHLQSGQTARVPMMNQSGEYSYLKAKNFAAVALPYCNGAMSFYLLLPDKGLPLATLLKTLNAKQWSAWRGQMEEREGHISIPRFKLSFDEELKNALSTLGMSEAFSARADFSAMRKERDLFISAVRHKAVIEVDEKGTVAAAATQAVGATKDKTDEPFQFIADRPFLALLCDERSGSILFLCALRDPA